MNWGELVWLSVHIWLLVMDLVGWIMFSTAMRLWTGSMVLSSIVVSWVVRLSRVMLLLRESMVVVAICWVRSMIL